MVPKSEQGTLRDIHFLSVILHTSPPVIITLTSLFFILPLGLLKIQTKSYTLTYTHVPPPNPSSVEWSNYTLPTLRFLSLNRASRPRALDTFVTASHSYTALLSMDPIIGTFGLFPVFVYYKSCHNEWPCERAISYFCSHIFGIDS